MVAGFFLMNLLHRASRRTPCLLHWSAADLGFLASNVIGLPAMHTLPFLMTPGLVNVFYIGGHHLILAGVRRHLGLRPRYDWLAALALVGLVVLALHSSGCAHGPVGQRPILLTPLVVGINAAVVWLLARQTDRAVRGSYLPLLLVEAAFLTQMALRALFLALGKPPQLTFMGNQIWQTARPCISSHLRARQIAGRLRA